MPVSALVVKSDARVALKGMARNVFWPWVRTFSTPTPCSSNLSPGYVPLQKVGLCWHSDGPPATSRITTIAATKLHAAAPLNS